MSAGDVSLVHDGSWAVTTTVKIKVATSPGPPIFGDAFVPAPAIFPKIGIGYVLNKRNSGPY
jgi:hypothetical protein